MLEANALAHVKARLALRTPIGVDFIDRTLVQPYHRPLAHRREDDLGVQEQLGGMENPSLYFDPKRRILNIIIGLVEANNEVASLSEEGLLDNDIEARSFKDPGEVMKAVAVVMATEKIAVASANRSRQLEVFFPEGIRDPMPIKDYSLSKEESSYKSFIR